jgi:legumain
VKKNGIPESNIIMMMQDDVANAAENPFPGQLFNKPTAKGVAGDDVYAGCAPDYTGTIVTAKLFLAVITGDSAAVANLTTGYTAGKTSTKVLKSTATSKVFLNFVDHGGVGLIAMPNGPFLYAKDLQAALATMKTKQLYKELVFYVEACESGSMFESFPTDNSMYVTTAANAKESSWGTYCPPADMVNGVAIKSCLGDLYSVNWMEDSEKQIAAVKARRLGAPAPNADESLEMQYTTVKKLTNKSHVMEFGDTSFTSTSITDFQGIADSANAAAYAPVAPVALTAADEADAALKLSSAVPSPDIPLHLAYAAYRSASGPTATSVAAKALRVEIEERETTARIFRAAAAAIGGDALFSNGARNVGAVLRECACHQRAMASYAKQCRPWSDHSSIYSRVVVAMCEATAFDVAPIAAAFAEAC